MPSLASTLFPFDVHGVSGIYCGMHRSSGMCYVGSALNIFKRIQEHIYKAFHGGTTLFHCALREFGIDAFEFSVLEECGREVILQRERFYIVLMNSASLDGFNIRENPTATYDFKMSQSSKMRLSIAKKGKPLTEAHKKAVGNGVRGRVNSPKTRAKLSAILKGRKITWGREIAKSRVGMKLSESHKRAIGNGLKGRTFSDESIRLQNETRFRKVAELGPTYWDKRKPVVAIGDRGEVIHLFESVMDAAAGLSTPTSSITYYLRIGRKSPLGFHLYYATVKRVVNDTSSTPLPA